MRAFTVDVSGIRLYVREWGDADRPPLLYWDGLGGCGLHANEIAPILTREYGLRIIAPDPPGHGRSSTPPLEVFRPSALATLAAELLCQLGISRAAFVGFSWGAEIGCAFAARFPQRTTRLVLIDEAYVDFADLPNFDPSADLSAHVAAAREKAGDDSFPSWEAYYAAESAALRRWTPALAEAHREMMREHEGRIVPILPADVVGAINYGNCTEPTASTYPALCAARIPILLVTPEQTRFGAIGRAGIARFQADVPQLRIEQLPGDVHDLVSHAPAELAAIVGSWLSGRQPS